MRIVFLIRQLGAGGAERQLALLARGLQARAHRVTVLTFYPGGELGEELSSTGVPVHPLGKRSRWDLAGFGVRLARALHRERPDVVYAFLTVANLVAAIARPLIRAPIVWGVRSSALDLYLFDRLTRFSYRLERLLSSCPDRVIVNSRSGLTHLRSIGFPTDTLRAVANGTDTVRFRPDDSARQRARDAWGAAPDETWIGLVARIDPLKDHATFLRAAALLSKRLPRVRFVLAGGGQRAPLERLARDLGVGDRLLWLGHERDPATLYNGLDALVSSSLSEGFPNGVAEAMACGTPCVVTDVGDSAELVGDTGLVVAKGDPQALVAGCLALLEGDYRRAGDRARQRVVERFGSERLALDTERILAEVCRG